MATRRTARPTQKLVDPENAEKPILSSHRENIATGCANAAAKGSNATAAALSASDASQLPTSREPSTVDDVIDDIDDDQAHEEESSTDSAARPSKKSVRKRKRAESKTVEDTDATDVNGMYKDIQVIDLGADIDISTPIKKSPTCDVDQFFETAAPPKNGEKYGRCKCKLCWSKYS
ncbi:uncharacterized protein LACBIDRAFT_308061 [Laccaria bicolor S238N-H82]|uniref:Predicted protein n=1 Tax=Laccaria bicolor (strain S238N-H82 / ATCC MYA-4686) TaxID=486041 RepID=B0DRJ5_LACBS|nr:uncharacterized protein LACBIDRAFT_308061 [Laccaria bicolor S238N-H82]EDR02882.1 predicted protein [Laccaria bicolor S238N-H82]|eukprot:XP_001886592.1 predicted protein [Laccaria bicolor S238N-H82]